MPDQDGTSANDSRSESYHNRPRRTREEVLRDIATFLSASLAFIIALLNRVLRELTGQIPSGEISSLRHSNLLKRKRDDNSIELTTHWRNLLKRFMIFHREMHCPWYIKPRTHSWYTLYIDWVPSDDPERFRSFFRVSVALFQTICERIYDDMVTKPPIGLYSLPNRKLVVPQQVAIAIRRLSTGDQVLGIGELFGVSASTVVKCTHKFVKAVNRKFKDEIKWPTGDALEEVKEAFRAKGFPNCCGAVDGTHFPIELPRGESSTDYYDYKHNISVSLQAIVDTKCRFLDICAGWPGSVQDSRLMRNSGFYRDVVYRKEKLHGRVYLCRNGTTLREYLLADAGYLLYDWMIVPFVRGIDERHDIYNEMHSSARMAVERAFGRLKGVWRILSRILWQPRVQTVGPMIFCCCVLHNLMIRHGEEPATEEYVSAHPTGYGPVLVPTREFYEGGPEARENIMNELLGPSGSRRQVNRNLNF